MALETCLESDNLSRMGQVFGVGYKYSLRDALNRRAAEDLPMAEYCPHAPLPCVTDARISHNFIFSTLEFSLNAVRRKGNGVGLGTMQQQQTHHPPDHEGLPQAVLLARPCPIVPPGTDCPNRDAPKSPDPPNTLKQNK